MSPDHDKALQAEQLSMLKNTVITGRIDIVRFLFESPHFKIKQPANEILIFAAQSGEIELINYFIQEHHLNILHLANSNSLEYQDYKIKIQLTTHSLGLVEKKIYKAVFQTDGFIGNLEMITHVEGLHYILLIYPLLKKT